MFNLSLKPVTIYIFIKTQTSVFRTPVLMVAFVLIASTRTPVSVNQDGLETDVKQVRITFLVYLPNNMLYKKVIKYKKMTEKKSC